MTQNKPDTFYCVFWYPTIFHREKEERKNIKHIDLPISDGSDFERNLSFIQDNERNLIFTIKDVIDGKTREFEFTFKKTAESRNGFVVYSYDKEVFDFFGNQSKDNDNKENNNDKDLDCVFLSCYHYAKSLYHEHEVHNESDARIKAYYFKTEGHKRVYLSEEPDISTLNHEVIDFFLGQYEQLFCRYYAENISKSYKDFMWYIQQLGEKPNEILHGKLKETPTDSKLIDLALLWFQNKKKDIDELLKEKNEEESIQGHTKSDNGLSDTEKLNEIILLSDYIEQNRARVLVSLLGKVLKLCGNALTEYTYCKTLLESKYNSYTHHDVVFTEDEIRDLSGNNCDPTLIKRDLRRKRAFNIRNSIRYIEGIRNKCNIWENDLLQDVMNLNQKMLKISNTVNKGNKDMLISSKKSNTISIVLGVLSVALGVLSIVLAVDSCYRLRKPSNLQEKTQKIEQTIKETSAPPVPSFPEKEYQLSPKE